MPTPLVQTPVPLPIDDHLDSIVESLRRCPNLVLTAAPGSGKTTRVPPRLVAAGFAQVWVLEPRRLAAKLAAERISEESRLTGRPCATGYHFRFEKKFDQRTQLLFMTEGMFLRRLSSNPSLNGVAALVFDEVHEQSLDLELALALSRRLQRATRPDLALIAMSGTLDATPLSKFLGECPITEVSAPHFPIDIVYCPLSSSPGSSPGDLSAGVKAALKVLLDCIPGPEPHGSGDILVFLPGIREISRTAEVLEAEYHPRELEVAQLHGDFSPSDIEKALRPDGPRRVILSTNLAESSVTLPGVTAVIDSGLSRENVYFASSGVSRLMTRASSRASAAQRAARSARLGPGRCVRLYSKADHDGRSAQSLPEISRADLSETVLSLACAGISRVSDLEFLNPPRPGSIDAALRTLVALGAIEPLCSTNAGTATPLGSQINELPLPVRLAKFYLNCVNDGVGVWGAWLAALLSEGSATQDRGRDPEILPWFVKILPTLARSGGTIAKVVQQLDPRAAHVTATPAPPQVDLLAKNLAHAFFDFLANRRGQTQRFQLARGGEIEVSGSLPLTLEWLVAIDSFVPPHASIPRAATWLNLSPELLNSLMDSYSQIDSVLEWSPESKSVREMERLTYQSLVLDESSRRPGEGTHQSSILLAREALGFTLPRDKTPDELNILVWDPAICSENFGRYWTSTGKTGDLLSEFSRIALFLGSNSLTWPMLSEFLKNFLSVDEIKAYDWPRELAVGLLGSEAAAKAARSLPRSITLASGRPLWIQYRVNQDPWVEAKLQEFKNTLDLPSLKDGQGRSLKLCAHLLAPNSRPVQVTSDLKSFWTKTYPELRTALSRRYPRHEWP